MSPYSKNIKKPLGKMKTILTEDLPDYDDDDDFGGTRSQTKFTATGHYLIPPKNLANNSASNSTGKLHGNVPNNFWGNPSNSTASNFASNLPNNSAGNFTNNSPSNLVANPPRNLAGSQATSSQNAIEALLLTGMLKEVLTGDKTRQSIADNKLAKENQLAQEAKAARQRATPPRVMSKEEEWYPVSYAQKQKEKEEAEWVANNPNATAAELFYPSMRKTVSPVIPPETQPANSPASKVVSGFTRVANAGEMGQGAEAINQNEKIPGTGPLRLSNQSHSELAALKDAEKVALKSTAKPRTDEVGKETQVNNQKNGAPPEVQKPLAEITGSFTYRNAKGELVTVNADREVVPQNAGQSANSPITKYGVANRNTNSSALTQSSTERTSSEVEAQNAESARIMQETSEYIVRKALSAHKKNKESVNVPPLSVWDKQAIVDGLTGSSGINNQSKEARKTTEATLFEKTLHETGAILGDTVEAMALAFAATYMTPIGTGVVMATAAGIATTLLYDAGKELYNQHERGEPMDFSKAFAQPFKDGVASGMSAIAVKKMQPLLEVVKKLPYETVVVVLTELGEIAAGVASTISLESLWNSEMLNWRDWWGTGTTETGGKLGEELADEVKKKVKNTSKNMVKEPTNFGNFSKFARENLGK